KKSRPSTGLLYSLALRPLLARISSAASQRVFSKVSRSVSRSVGAIQWPGQAVAEAVLGARSLLDLLVAGSSPAGVTTIRLLDSKLVAPTTLLLSASAARGVG